MEFIRFYKQKRILHKYVRWLYELTDEGRFQTLPKAKKIKDFPFNWKAEDGGKIKYFEKMYHCADTFSADVDFDTGEHTLGHGFFCQDRICPVCCVKKSLKEYSKLTFQMNYFKKDYTYYFLTLTLPNNPDGFRSELDLLSKILTELGDFVGFDHTKRSVQICEGLYGSYEITKSDYGWHPHLHLVLAYPTNYVQSTASVKKTIRGRERVFENGLDLRAGDKSLFLNQDIIMNKYIQLIRKYTDIYDERLEDLNFLNIGFQPCYNIEQGVNEMSKYLIDFEAIQNKDDLFIYIRDSYGKKQRVRRGCFIWTEEVAEAHREFMDRWHLEQNLNFMQLGEAVDPESITRRNVHPAHMFWSYNGFVATYLAEKEYTIPFTSTKKIVFYYHRIKITPCFDSSGAPMGYHVERLPDLLLSQVK